MKPLEHLMFAELALEYSDTMAAWAAIQHIRRARQQLIGNITIPEPDWPRLEQIVLGG